MSSIRLFILGSLVESGPMHGHALRLLAEEELVEKWADVSPGAIYGAIKRLAAEELIEVERVERDGNYPERQVYAVTATGLESLRQIRNEALERIVYRPDPFDLALCRLGDENIDGLRETLETRLATFRDRLANEELKLDQIGQFLTTTEKHVTKHDKHRIRGEIAWLEELIEALPEILDDELSRKRPS